MRVARIGTVAFAAAGIALAACGEDRQEGSGGGSGGAEESSGGASPQTVKISATDFKFDPANPKVETGKVSFELTNDGKAPHALEVEGPKGEVETATIQPGKSSALLADLSKPGSYTIYCPVGNHREMGMEGKVKVAGGGSGRSDDSGKQDDSGGGGGGGGY